MHSEPLGKISVLIADDSFFVRTYLTALLESDPEISIVGTASSGGDVVTLASELHPDVITMDYHMPVCNGIEATAKIMQGEARPLPAIIMLSAFSGKEGKDAREILEASGAHIIAKPSGEISLDIEKIAASIIEKIKEVGRLQIITKRAYARAQRGGPLHLTKHVLRTDDARVVCIGASTGGPPLIEHLLSLLDPSDGESVVIAQHMSKYFTLLFAERLNRVSPFRVREARDGDVLTPGTVLVVPGGFALAPHTNTDGAHAFHLVPLSGVSGEVMIDETMSALAQSYGRGVVGVLLSGMGQDGTRGLRAIREHGGLSLVQDPSTATISAMPNHAMHEGVENEVLSIDDIPERINAYFA